MREKIMTCYLLRHGKDNDQLRGGWSAAELTEQGILDIQMLADQIAQKANLNIKKIFASDLPRAKQTAEIIATTLKINVEYLPQFREANNGILAGMDNETASIQFPGLYWNTLEWDECYPSGESPHQFFDRISTAWHNFKKMLKTADSNVLLITHGGVINVIYHMENGIPFSNKNKPFPIKASEMISFEIK